MEMARKTGVIVAMSVLLIATQAWAEVTYTKVTAASTNDVNDFGHTSLESQVSNIDLINTGQASLSSTTGGTPLFNSSSAQLNNGSQFDPILGSTAGVYYGNDRTDGSLYSYIPKDGTTWDVILNGTFSIGKIVSYTGTDTASNRTRQDYTVAFSTNGGANFDAPTVFVNAANEAGAAMQVTVENTGSALATNVNAMRFTFSGFKDKEAAYREIDVFRTPEPTLLVAAPGDAVALPPIIKGATSPSANITVTETSNSATGSYRVGSVTGRFTVAGASSTGNVLPQGVTTTHAVSYGDVNTVGSVSGSVTITGEAPTTGSGTVALSGRVYDHANAALSVTSGNNQRVIKGTAGITAGLTLTNIGGDNAPADVANLSIGLSGLTGSGTVAADGSVAYTAALDTVTSGRGQSQSFGLHAGDQEILPGHDSLALLIATVTVDVLDHANGTFANVVGAVGTPSGGGKVLSLDFGTVTVGTGGGNLDATFDVFANVVGAATANLVLTGITGDITKLSGETSFTNLAAGDVKGYTFHFSTAVAGTFNAAYTFNLFDEAGVLGGTGDTLTLEVTGIVSEAPALHPGDVNGDGIVNFLDYNIVKTNYLSNGVGWAGGDLNGDGVVNFLDYNIVKTHYLHTNAANGSGVMAVPEPATFLCLFGVVPILTGRKRRAKA